MCDLLVWRRRCAGVEWVFSAEGCKRQIVEVGVGAPGAGGVAGVFCHLTTQSMGGQSDI
jgi:hypothetical protein